MSERSYPTILLVGILACIVIFSVLSVRQTYIEKKEIAAFSAFKTEQKLSTFVDTPLEAQSVYVYDVTENEVLFERDAGIPRGIASITKLMTFAVTWPFVKDMEYITASKNAIATEGYSPLQEGVSWTPENLLALMLVSSSNDAAELLAEASEQKYGSELNVLLAMNQFAKDHGMEKSLFKNVTGLDESDRVSNISTAYDINTLAQTVLAIYPELLEATARVKVVIPEEGIEVQNTNTIIEKIPNIILSKTGYTDYAGGTLVVAYRSPSNNHIIISTVLGSSYEGRFKDTLTLIERTENYFKQIEMIP